MKKETLLEIILGTIGGLVFAIGTCMCLLPEWNMLTTGIITTIIGLIILLCITWIVGLVGALIMGFGMSKIMVGEVNTLDMIIGIIIGVVGLIICVLNYPIYAYIKSNKE